MTARKPKKKPVLRAKPTRKVMVEYRTNRGRKNVLVFRSREEASDCIYTRAVCEGGVIPSYVYETIGDEDMKYLRVVITIGMMGETKVTLGDIRDASRNKHEW